LPFSERTKFQYILNQRPFKENTPSIDFNACQNLPSTSFTSIGRSFLSLHITHSNKFAAMLIHKVCYHASPYSHKSATMLVLILISALYHTSLSTHRSAFMLQSSFSQVRYHASLSSHKSVTLLVLLLRIPQQ
jgi:hypothetical protein